MLETDKLLGRTKKSFGYEWLRYPTTLGEEENRTFFDMVGLTEEAFKNKFVLDAGCGMGRYARITAKFASSVVAFDLSRSVERIKDIINSPSKIYPLQANIMALPFKNGIFDIVFSVGVIQHTASPKEAFKKLACLLKSGGIMSIHVYVKKLKSIEELKQTTLEKDKRILLDNIEKNFFKKIKFELYLKLRFLRTEIIKTLRNVSTKVPERILYFLSFLAIPKIGRFTLLNFSIPCSSHPNIKVRILETFDWYSPPYLWLFQEQELISWFKEQGFYSIEVSAHGFSPVSVTVKGIKK